MKGTVQKLEKASETMRVVPHNAEAERQLLGAIMVNNETYYRVSEFLEARHFFLAPHKDIYDKCGALIKAGKIASLLRSKRFSRQMRRSQTCLQLSICCVLLVMRLP